MAVMVVIFFFIVFTTFITFITFITFMTFIASVCCHEFHDGVLTVIGLGYQMFHVFHDFHDVHDFHEFNYIHNFHEFCCCHGCPGCHSCHGCHGYIFSWPEGSRAERLSLVIMKTPCMNKLMVTMNSGKDGLVFLTNRLDWAAFFQDKRAGLGWAGSGFSPVKNERARRFSLDPSRFLTTY